MAGFETGHDTEINFESALENYLNPDFGDLEEGSITKGEIVRVDDDNVLVDVNFKSEGQIPAAEFRDPAGNICVKVGDRVDVYVVRKNENDGTITLSFEKAKRMNLDIQDLIRNNRALAERDALTNLLVRRQFFTVAQEAVAEARKKRTPLCAAMIDVDYFKQVNDRYGHLAGDIALRQLGAMLREEFPAPYICGRYGGEEFCVVAPGMDKKDFAHKLENFRTTVSSKPVQIGALSIVISVSIGMAELRANDLETLISAADAQLYTAKREGRDRFVWQP